MHFNFHCTFNLTKLFWPPLFTAENFLVPPLLATQNFFGPPSILPSPPTKVFMNTPLGSTDPCATAVHMKPLSTTRLGPQGSQLSICYYHQNMCLCVVKTACSVKCCPLEINTISMDTINRLPSFNQLYYSFSAHIFEFYFYDVLILCFLD